MFGGEGGRGYGGTGAGCTYHFNGPEASPKLVS